MSPTVEPTDAAVEAFWETAKHRARLVSIPGYFGPTPAEAVCPPAWSFGASSELADALLDLVLAGEKTATASAVWDYEAEGEDLPAVGALSIIADGSGVPRALIVTTSVRVVPFDRVDAEHARLEGEGDRSLEYWRRTHEWFFTEHSVHGRGFATDMPVILERFALLYQE